MAEQGEHETQTTIESSNKVREEVPMSTQGAGEANLDASIAWSNPLPTQSAHKFSAYQRRRLHDDSCQPESSNTQRRKMERYEKISHVVGKAAAIRKWYDKMKVASDIEYEELIIEAEKAQEEFREQAELRKDIEEKSDAYMQEAVKRDLMANEARMAARTAIEDSDIRYKDVEINAAERKLELYKKQRAVLVALYEEHRKILEG